MINNNGQNTNRSKFSGDISSGNVITVDNSGNQGDDGSEGHSEEQSEGDSDTTGDTVGSGSNEMGDFWAVDRYIKDSDGSSDSGESGLGWCKYDHET